MQLDKIKIIAFDEIDSTNDYLINNYQKLQSYTIVKTNFQTKGRGQFKRGWFSNKGENLLFSILLKDILIKQIDLIKNIVKESLIKLLEQYNIKGIFKEPNDILVNSKKILGILIETKTKNHEKFDYIVIGIGININQKEFNDLNATSFYNITNKKYNNNEILQEFIKIFCNKLRQL